MRSNIKQALLVSFATVVASTAVLAPLKADNSLGRPILNDIVGIMLGAALAGTATLLLLVVPLLFALRWWVADRIALRREVWAVLGGLVVLFFMVAADSVAAAMFDVSHVEFAASWPSLILGGGVCGWFLFSKTWLRTDSETRV